MGFFLKIAFLRVFCDLTVIELFFFLNKQVYKKKKLLILFCVWRSSDVLAFVHVLEGCLTIEGV